MRSKRRAHRTTRRTNRKRVSRRTNRKRVSRRTNRKRVSRRTNRKRVSRRTNLKRVSRRTNRKRVSRRTNRKRTKNQRSVRNSQKGGMKRWRRSRDAGGDDGGDAEAERMTWEEGRDLQLKLAEDEAKWIASMEASVTPDDAGFHDGFETQYGSTSAGGGSAGGADPTSPTSPTALATRIRGWFEDKVGEKKIHEEPIIIDTIVLAMLDVDGNLPIDEWIKELDGMKNEGELDTFIELCKAQDQAVSALSLRGFVHEGVGGGKDSELEDEWMATTAQSPMVVKTPRGAKTPRRE
jgi:hypothetical protein